MKKQLFLIPILMLLMGCNTQQASSKQEEPSKEEKSSEIISSEEKSSEVVSSDQSSEEASSSSEEVPPEPGTEVTKKITFKGDNKRPGFSNGAKLDEEGKGAQPEFYKLFNGESGTLLESISSTKCFFQAHGGNASGISTLCIGSSKADGSLELNFGYSIKSLTVVAQAYYNQYTIQGTDYFTVDQNVKLKVNGGAISVPSTEGETPSELTKEYSFAGDGVTQLVFESVDSVEGASKRVYINEITITYVA